MKSWKTRTGAWGLAGTLRLELFKIGALVQKSLRRVVIQMSSAYPGQALFHTLAERLRRFTRSPA